MTPFRDQEIRVEQLYNESQIRTKNPIERCFGICKLRSPVLAMGIKISTQYVEAIIVATAFLHNVAGDMHLPEPVDDDVL